MTGGTGFIGSHLIEAFTEIGLKLKILDPFRSKTNSIWIERNFSDLKDIEIIKGNILDRNLLNRSLQDIDSVIHLASKSDIPYSIKDPFTVFETNCTGTMTLLEQCRLFKIIKCIVLISSAHVYSMPPKYLPIDENHPLNTSTPMEFQRYFKI